MISWLQTNFQKHFRIMFIVLLVVIVVAFVFTIGNQGSFGGADRDEASDRRFFEVSLNTRAKLERFLQRDPQLASFLGGQRQAVDPYFRAAALHLANLHKVPEPTTAELEAFIKTRPIFLDRAGVFNPQTYSIIIDNFTMGGQATEADIKRVLVDEFRIEKVRSVLSGPGYTDKEEILEQIREGTATWSVLVATFDTATYTPEVEITEDTLTAYFEANKQRYATPTRRKVRYVEFDPANFSEAVTTTDEQLATYFENNYDRYQPKPPEPVEGEEPAVVEPVTFEQARSAVRNDYRIDQAVHLAEEKAHDFVLSILDDETPNTPEALSAKAAAFGVELKSTPHFSANERPIGTIWPREAVSQAFLLSPSKFYGEPFKAGDVSVVMFYEEEQPSVLPQLTTVANTVANDYRAQELVKRRAEYAKQLRETLAAADSEEAFGAAAEEAGLTVASFENFSLRQPAQGLDTTILGAFRNLEPMQVSQPTPTSEPGKFAYVFPLSKQTQDVSVDSPEYQEMAGYLSEYFGNMTANNYLNALVLAEAARAEINIQQQN